MGHGGHHGGGFHGGGHHGGFHGGGFHGGGGHYGGYYGGSGYSDDPGEAKAVLWIRLFMIYICLIALSVSGDITFLNPININIFAAGIVFAAIGLRTQSRTAVISKIKGNLPVLLGDIAFNGDRPIERYGDGSIWAGKKSKKYRINFHHEEYGTICREVVEDTISRTPRIVWTNLWVWVIGIGIGFFINLFFYESVIPTFENMWMSDEAFAFIDDLVYYFPSLVCLLSGIICFVLAKVRDSILHKCACRIVQEISSMKEKAASEKTIKTELMKKWYYKVCPNCGAAAGVLKSCGSCGSSLEVKDGDVLNSSVYRMGDYSDISNMHDRD